MVDAAREAAAQKAAQIADADLEAKLDASLSASKKLQIAALDHDAMHDALLEANASYIEANSALDALELKAAQSRLAYNAAVKESQEAESAEQKALKQ